MNHPQPQILTIWRISLTLAAIVPAFLISLLLKRDSAAWMISVGFLALLYLAAFVVYLPLLFRKISYSVSGERIVYKTGVFYHRVITAPVAAVQYVSVSQSVIERMFGVASVVATFAGGRVMLGGLKTADAEQIAQLLQSRKG